MTPRLRRNAEDWYLETEHLWNIQHYTELYRMAMAGYGLLDWNPVSKVTNICGSLALDCHIWTPLYRSPENLAVLNGFTHQQLMTHPFPTYLEHQSPLKWSPVTPVTPVVPLSDTRIPRPVSASMAVKAASASWGHFGRSPCLGLVELQVPIFTHTVAVNQHMLVDTPRKIWPEME